MHLVLLHGYLLRGTGSNIYVANIARAWRAQGHAVTVICQERMAGGLSFVGEYVGPDHPLPPAPPPSGTIRVVAPEIDDLLPVYVLEHYAGFDVKTIPTMHHDEIERHIALTGDAVRAVVRQGVGRVLANHVLLSPVIARRALRDSGVPYDVKIHGSALEYTLVPNPRLMPYAAEGLAGAETVFAGTRHVHDRAVEVFADVEGVELGRKLRIVPPGMDPDLFRPTDEFSATASRLGEKLAARIAEHPQGRRQHPPPDPAGRTADELHAALTALGETYERRAIDADLMERWPALRPDEPIVLYLGNFLDTKGVGELLLTVPTMLALLPAVRFVFVGYGPYREHLDGMLAALAANDVAAVDAFARAGAFVTEADVADWYRPLTPAERDRIVVTGMLDHHVLSDLLPLASVSVVPSKWPEAFGMVAVEAMAAGVLPLCTYHAGLRDVVDAVRDAAPDLADLMALDRSRFVSQLPERVRDALAHLYPGGFADVRTRRRIGATLREVAVERFAWDRIARRLLE